MRVALILLALLGALAAPAFANTRLRCDMKGDWIEDRDSFTFVANYVAKGGPDTFSGIYANASAGATANITGMAANGTWTIRLTYTDAKHRGHHKELVGKGARDATTNAITIKGKYQAKVNGGLLKSGTFTLAGKCNPDSRLRSDTTCSTMNVLINIDVPDLEAATQFYVDAFGFTVGRRMGPDFRELLGAAIPIYLLVKEPGSEPFPAAPIRRSFDRHWTPVHMDIAVDDLEASIERALAAGARRESGITSHAWGRMCLLVDPFGNGVCLLDLTPGYDAITVA